MSAPAGREAHSKTGNLLGVLAFLGKYPGRVLVCFLLLLSIVGLDLSLPQFIGEAMTQMQREKPAFERGFYVQFIPSLVLVRSGLPYVLGPIRNRTIQATLGDIRA